MRIAQEQKAIIDVLCGEKDLAPDVKALHLFDKSGALDLHSPLLDATRIFLASRQNKKERTLGKDLLDEFARSSVRLGSECGTCGGGGVRAGRHSQDPDR